MGFSNSRRLFAREGTAFPRYYLFRRKPFPHHRAPFPDEDRRPRWSNPKISGRDDRDRPCFFVGTVPYYRHSLRPLHFLGSFATMLLMRVLPMRGFRVAAKQRSLLRTFSRGSSKDEKLKSLEEIFQKKTPIEHVLLRPEMYLGPVSAVSRKEWVFNRCVSLVNRNDLVLAVLPKGWSLNKPNWCRDCATSLTKYWFIFLLNK